MKKVSILLVTLMSTSTGLAQQQMDTIQWLTESSFDLQTTNPDLKITGIPFERILKNMELVLVGEATHGTKEFAEIKHRLFRYLVEELGFRYFFVEADFGAGLTVDQYICGEGGDPVEVLKGLRFFHIVNKEGLALIKWMKVYNQTKIPADKIRFFGIDCQSSEGAFTRLTSYFERVDSVFYKQMYEIKLKNRRSPGQARGLGRKYDLLTLSLDTISILKNRLIDNEAVYKNASSDMEYKIALRLTEALVQSSKIFEGNYDYKIREEAMAANVAWALSEIDSQPKKAFLWAHNDHVMYSELTETNTGRTTSTLGRLLKNKLNENVYSIGVEFNHGSFIANEVKLDTIVKRLWTVSKAPENTFPFLLSRTHLKVLFMDFHSIKNQNMATWLRQGLVRGHNIAALYFPDERFRPFRLTDQFDGLIFINETHEITLDLN